MFKNNKSIEDTYATKSIIQNIVGQAQIKQVMAKQTPMRYTLKAIMAGFLLSIVTVFMLAIKTQFASTHNDGLINLMGAIAFSLGLVLVVLTNSELLTSNFMYLTVGWYYRAISVSKMIWIFIFCFIGNILGGFILFFLMKYAGMMFFNMDGLSWLGVLKNIVFAFLGNYIGGGIFIGLVYAYLNGKRDSLQP